LPTGKKETKTYAHQLTLAIKKKREASRLIQNRRKPGYLLGQAHDGTLKRNEGSVAPPMVWFAPSTWASSKLFANLN
jgi:hypothetical protein